MLVPESHSVYPVRTIIVMGVSGCGKSTIGKGLARMLGGVPFIDADSLHSQTNKAKMASGIPLGDSDRWPWLASVRDRITDEARTLISEQNSAVMPIRRIVNDRQGHDSDTQRMYVVCSCSALRRSYREYLSRGDSGTAPESQTHDTVFVYVDVPRAVLAERLAHRKDHFFDPRLLDSQIATLEVPDPEREPAVAVHGDVPQEDVVLAAYNCVRSYVSKNSL